ncbi:MAG: YqgE/AlgH family protein [Betaproteobacteria bacterium]|nr:YqgE/AlgH family protein [Betaproteobacteria bacterium]
MATAQSVNLTRHFLIAMPAMADPHFSKTLTFICEHNNQGALGVVVNRPIDMTLHALLEQIELKPADDSAKATSVHYGGPVQIDRGFVLHTPAGAWQSTLAVGDMIGLTTSKDILQAVARGEGPRQFLVTLGYAGWAPGQLEQELAQNAWLTVPADPRVLFDTPAKDRYDAGLKLLGIDLGMLSDGAGHA